MMRGEWAEIHTEGTRSYRMRPLPKEGEGFAWKMLRDNVIPGFLRAEEREKNGDKAAAFEISSLISLEEICEANPLSASLVYSLVNGIQGVLGQTEEFLLEPDGISWKPEEIYRREETGEWCFLCLPYSQGEWRNGLKELFRYLMEKIDYREEDGVRLVYELYHLCAQERVSFERLRAQTEMLRRQKEEAAEEKTEEETGIPDEERISDTEEKSEKNDLRKGAELFSKWILPAAGAVLLWYLWFGK